MLSESSLPIIQVAFASGFESVRRFNALFRSHYRLTPTDLRRLARPSTGDRVRLTLAYRPPLYWAALLRFLNGRATARVEQVVGQAYIRTAAVGKYRGWLKVEPVAGRDALAVEIATSLVPALPEILSRLKNLFDLSARPDVIASHLAADERFARPGSAVRGAARVPGAFDGFELTVRAILGQRVSVRAATTLAGRLAARYRRTVETPFAGLDRLSPAAARIADAPAAEIASLGIAAPRAATIRSIAQAVIGRELDLQAGADPVATALALQAFPGIGDWTAQYIAMRALRWPDAFPAGDLVLLRAAGAEITAAASPACRSLAPLAVVRSHVSLGIPAPSGTGEPR